MFSHTLHVYAGHHLWQDLLQLKAMPLVEMLLVVGDKLYGGKRYLCPAGLERQFLHAHSLTFTAPSGKKLELVSPLPKDLADALGVLRAAK